MNITNGYDPSSLVIDSQGNLYGTTAVGGTSFPTDPNGSGYGTVFALKRAANGGYTYSDLFDFNNLKGANPNNLVIDSQGNLFGTAGGGITLDGFGLIFMLKPSGNGSYTYADLLDFLKTNGSYPSSLIVDGAGNVYGTTSGGGASVKSDPSGSGYGTIFALKPAVDGGYTYSDLFDFDNTHGSSPTSLVIDSQGNIYGTAAAGGGHGYGTVFVLRPTGSGSYMYVDLLDAVAQAYPNHVVVDRLGNLYGTTDLGGASLYTYPNIGYGTVYKLARATSPPLSTRFDFTGSGSNGLLLQSAALGTLADWPMSGMIVTGGLYLDNSVAANWQVASVVDLNNDGHPDIIWQNSQTGAVAYWLMNGTQLISGVSLSAGGDPTWKLVGSADLFNTGVADLLWQNSSTGTLAFWTNNGLTFLGSTFLAGDPAWRLVGAVDLNGDNIPELIFQNKTTGAVAYWTMRIFNGIYQYASGGYLTDGVPEWRLVGFTSLDGQNDVALLWQDTVTGATAYWNMNGFNVASGGYLPSLAGSDYQIVGMH